MKHILLECPALERERMKCFGVGGLQLSPRDLLGDESNHIHNGALFAFVATTGLQVTFSGLR